MNDNTSMQIGSLVYPYAEGQVPIMLFKCTLALDPYITREGPRERIMYILSSTMAEAVEIAEFSVLFGEAFWNVRSIESLDFWDISLHGNIQLRVTTVELPDYGEEPDNE